MKAADSGRALRDHDRAFLSRLDDPPDRLLDARPLALYLDVDRYLGELIVDLL
jgi:hypothetical protein